MGSPDFYCVPRHMVRPATAVALDGRERRHVQRAWGRRARHKAVVDGVVRTRARDMPKLSAVLRVKNKNKLTLGVCMWEGHVHSIFGYNLADAASSTPLGCVRCRRTSSILPWQRRCAARDMPTACAPVCGSCSTTAPVTSGSRQCGRLSVFALARPNG